jgi:general secretion pathway protein G
MNRSSVPRTAGFTLLEIMLVVSIIILLLGAAIYKFRGAFDTAKIGKAQGDISTLSLAVTTYETLARTLPSTAQGLKALVERPSSDPRPAAWTQQMSSLPKDPWNQDYYYEQPGKHNANGFDLYSAGPDKQAGTVDDIGNWQQ